MPSESTINEPAVPEVPIPRPHEARRRSLAGPEHGDPLMIPKSVQPDGFCDRRSEIWVCRDLPSAERGRSRFGRLVAADLDVLSSLAESEIWKTALGDGDRRE